MNTPPRSFDTWEAALAAGRAEEANPLYLRNVEQPDPQIISALRSCKELRAALRGKAWDKALAHAETFTTGVLPLNLEQLRSELELLAAAGDALSRHAAEEVAPLLENVTSPLLRGEVYTLLGTAAIYGDDAHGAQTYFEKAVESDPRHFRAVTNLGNLALEAGDLDEAIEAYQRALTLNDQFANAHHNLGVAYRRKGEFGKSVRSLRRAQGASQRSLREQARTDLSRSRPGVKRTLRWLLYGGAALLVYSVLRANGLL